jgi:hypothetical protein
LSDNKVDYKKSILLTLVKIYPSLTHAIKAGYPEFAIKNAVSVLRANGYTVNLLNGVITK